MQNNSFRKTDLHIHANFDGRECLDNPSLTSVVTCRIASTMQPLRLARSPPRAGSI
jgi:hypothetical protein